MGFWQNILLRRIWGISCWIVPRNLDLHETFFVCGLVFFLFWKEDA